MTDFPLKRRSFSSQSATIWPVSRYSFPCDFLVNCQYSLLVVSNKPQRRIYKIKEDPTGAETQKSNALKKTRNYYIQSI